VATKKLTKKQTDLIQDIVDDGEDKDLESKKRKHRLYMRMSRLADKAIDELERTLAEGGGRERLEAAKIILKSQGIDIAPEAQNDSTLTVVLPSGVQVSTTKPRTLEVTSEVQDEEN
jgi:hypothetical protein